MLIMKNVIKLLEEISYLLSPYTIISISYLLSSSKQIFRENNKVDIQIFNIYLFSVYSVLSTLGDYLFSSK